MRALFYGGILANTQIFSLRNIKDFNYKKELSIAKRYSPSMYSVFSWI